MKKRTKNRIADVREKRARFASGLARTARSARLRFCLFRRFVFIQGVCLSRRAQRADLFKTSIRLSAKGVKYRDKSRRVWGVCIIVKLYRWLTICAKCVYYKGAINLINLGKTFTSVTDAFFALHSFSQIEHVGLSQKSAGMHFLYFY